jgi:glutathionyl-hydroquinone reductase
MAAQQGTDAKAPIYNFADKDGRFRREVSQFRDQISSDPNAKFPAEK